MELKGESFTIWAELEGWTRYHFFVVRDLFNGEARFSITSDNQSLGVLHKTFEDTWEWLQGNLTLQDAERLGDRIDAYYAC